MFGLPPDAAVWRNGKHWTTRDELLAVLLEETSFWGHMAARPHYQNPDRLQGPIRFGHPDRPSAAPKKRKPRNQQELARAFGLGG